MDQIKTLWQNREAQPGSLQRVVGAPHHIISLGAGVQSSTMALMAACGELSPMPSCAIFADTQAEPASVYRWLDWLEGELPFPVYRVSRGNLTTEALTIRNRRDGSGQWARSLLPGHVLNKDGSNGMMGRQCTRDYKVRMIEKKSRQVGNIQRRQKTVGVIQWIGISRDEIGRMKESRVPWAKHRWPLIEAEMTRQDCLEWMQAKGFPKPPRSACIYCPYHSNAEWRNLKDSEPDEWAKAVQFEKDWQAIKTQTGRNGGVPYLHASLKPLDQVDLSTEEERGQTLLNWGNECEGLCGV